MVVAETWSGEDVSFRRAHPWPRRPVAVPVPRAELAWVLADGDG